MTPRRLLILGALAIVAIVAALLLSQNRTASSDGPSAPLYPGLEKELGAIDVVKVFKSGDAPVVELQKRDTGWTVKEHSGYAADPAKVGQLLRGLAEAKTLEEKTSNPANYPALGVEDTNGASATGVRVELAGTAKPVNLIVGKQAPGARSQYVRRAGEAQSWLINTTLDTSNTSAAWLRKDILDVSADRIQSATVSIGTKSYAALKPSRTETNFKVEPLPKGKELSGPSAANTFATALVGLTLANVQPAASLSGDAAASADFKTFDGLVVHLNGWNKDGKHFITLKAAFEAEQAKRFHVPTATPNPDDQAKPASVTATSTQKIEEEARTINARVANWAYEIPDYKYEAIFKPLETLLKK